MQSIIGRCRFRVPELGRVVQSCAEDAAMMFSTKGAPNPDTKAEDKDTASVVATTKDAPQPDTKAEDKETTSIIQDSSTAPSEEDWTEVVHQTGQVYYWNQVAVHPLQNLAWTHL